jgi:FAD:protein FMN transferase
LFIRICFVAFLAGTVISGTAQQKRFSFTEPKMGSPFTIVLYSNDSLQATCLAKQSFKMVDSFNLIFSDYTDSSELGKLNASALIDARAIKVSPALYEIILLSKNAFDKSDGAFDITIGPLVKLWRKVRKTKQFPDRVAVESILGLTGFSKVIIDTVNKKVSFSKPGMQLDLGGIAKGWIAQKIIDFLNTQRVNHALVNAGGDIVMSYGPPGSDGWNVGVNVPETKDELLPETLLLQNMAVATSGDVYQFMENGGKKYSHIIDPRTGYGVTSQRNVTMIAKDGATADWLATACSILPVRKAKRLATHLGAEVLIAEIQKGKLVFNSSKGFTLYWKKENL